MLGVVGRAASDKIALLQLTTAAGAGQVVGPPLAQFLLSGMHWSEVFMIFAVIILASVMFLPFLKSNYKASKAELEVIRQIITRAAKDPNYIMIFIGFFSGFQLAFVTAHFPALVTETCLR